ncbi:protein get1 [Viridothelium virens]|uniref:Protein get1 n=1 Tax=Viridothelium virens TaxID=1048519 RepID=A0A6A6H074_VIRVR|nr:protein get1 [Viridothelium virens]
MASLLLWTFFLSLAIFSINTVGSSSINDFLWRLYNRLPVATSQAAKNQIRLRQEVVRLNKEISGVSAQDEFSKWAKLRRQLDKAKAEHDKSASTVESSKARFDYAVNIARWISTNGLRLFLQYWYSKEPMFWIPQGWVPSYVEWLLSFPRAPQGSISIQIWQIACTSVIGMVSEAIFALYALATKGASKEDPQAYRSGGEGKPTRIGGGPKKEL